MWYSGSRLFILNIIVVMIDVGLKEISILSSIGIVIFPLTIVWFVLKKGYSNTHRVICFIYFSFCIILLISLHTQLQEQYYKFNKDLFNNIFKDNQSDNYKKFNKFNLKDDIAILETINKPIVYQLNATNIYGQKLTTYYFSTDLKNSIDITLSRYTIYFSLSFDKNNIYSFNQVFKDGEDISKSLLGDDGQILFKKISKGDKFKEIFLNNGAVIKNARCDNSSCHYSILRE